MIAGFLYGEKTSLGLGDVTREEQEAKLAALRTALVKGENSGPSTPFDFDRSSSASAKTSSSAL
jgi:Arc/MetJ-type ribon-helix-helix transcriptional regulator